jgi:hypothetical protein
VAALQKQVAELQGELARARPSGHGIIDLTGGASQPANWERIWKAQYVPTDPPSENIRRLYAASGPDVKDLIDKLKKEKHSDLEILAALKLAFGPHEQ